MNNFVYYVNPGSTSYLELGTLEFPFKNFDSPAKEVFNFMYSSDTVTTTYVMRGTSMFIYYGLMPIIYLNINQANILPYGPSNLPKPYIYVTDVPYQWPDSTLFSLAETNNNVNLRVSRGDMQQSEASTYFLKFNIFRASLYVKSIDFQSIMFGDAWSNPLFFSFDAQNKSLTIEDAYLDLDGALCEGYFPISINLLNSHINLTNYQYGIWDDFR